MNANPASPPAVVILGAGHAGGTCAALLRQYGPAGPITLIQALRMDRLHFATHLRQIRRLQTPARG